MNGKKMMKPFNGLAVVLLFLTACTFPTDAVPQTGELTQPPIST